MNHPLGTTIGEIAYNAYVAAAQGKEPKVDARSWIELRPEVRDAWQTAAFTVRVADQGMRLREEVEQRLAEMVTALANYQMTDESAIEQSIWLHQRARELIWMLRPDLSGREHEHLLELIKAKQEAHEQDNA